MAGFDIVVIGAGLNGLVAANYLAKAGKQVVVLERRAIAGGQAVTESFGDARVDSLHAGGQIRPDIADDLNLAQHGLPASADAPLISILPDGRQLRLTVDSDEQTLESLRGFSRRDAERWPEFWQAMTRPA